MIPLVPKQIFLTSPSRALATPITATSEACRIWGRWMWKRESRQSKTNESSKWPWICEWWISAKNAGNLESKEKSPPVSLESRLPTLLEQLGTPLPEQFLIGFCAKSLLNFEPFLFSYFDPSTPRDHLDQLLETINEEKVFPLVIITNVSCVQPVVGLSWI